MLQVYGKNIRMIEHQPGMEIYFFNNELLVYPLFADEKVVESDQDEMRASIMNIKEGCRVRVIANYQAPYSDPIRVKVGEVVSIDDERNTDIAGWVWCTNREGRSGWVPEAFLDRHGMSGNLRCDYDAIELTVQSGEVFIVKKIESKFCWVEDPCGRAGWLPIDHITLHPDD